MTDELATKQVNIKDDKLSKLETVLNQSRVGFYTFLGLTAAAFGFGVVTDNRAALEIGDKLLLPVVGWISLYVATLVNKKED